MTKKTLLDQHAVDDLIARVEKLAADAPQKWGTMNATEMLLHCTLADTFVLEDKSPYKKPTFKHSLIKKVCIYILPKIPKNRKGPTRLIVKGKIKHQKFEEQKQSFINTLLRFPVHTQPLTSIHPSMGFLTTKEWGIIAWMHMDHHLRQFGV